MKHDTLSSEEMTAIELHKWYLSEKNGYDVGWDAAYSDWKMSYQDQWRKEQREQLLGDSVQEMKEIGEYTKRTYDRKGTEARRKGEKKWVERYAAEWRKTSKKIRPSPEEVKHFKEESGLHMAKYLIPNEAVLREIPITNELGLHVRPSLKLKLAIDRSHGNTVYVRNLSTHSPVSEIKDLCNILALGAICSDVLLFGVTGNNAEEVLDAIEEVLKEST